jgi:hypothetical protein
MSALVLETIMTGQPIGERGRHTHFTSVDARGERTASRFVPPSGTSGESLSEDLHVELESLQRLVCDLLFRNQQLRMALVEATSEEENLFANME